MDDLEELKNKFEYFQKKREEILACINSLKGQKEVLDSQKIELLQELKELGCNSSKELESKCSQLKTEIAEFTVDIPDDLCNLL